VKEEGANDPNSIRLSGGWLIIVCSDVNKEKHSYKNLNTKDNKALLQSKSLLKRGATLGHVGANSVVVNIRCEL